MQIKIGWQNINTQADGIRVYRSTSAINVNSLPAVYATLAGGASEFVDDSVVKDTLYYYVFEVYKGTDKIFSANIQATAAPYSGPGPQILAAGDLDAGYYGIVQSSDLLTWDAFVAWSGVTLGTKSTTTAQDWIKLAFKGKTLFIPRQPIGTVSWNTLYDAGLVYGVDGPGPREYNTRPVVNQLKTLVAANSTFKVRLPTALPPGFDLTKDFTSAAVNPTVAYIGNNTGMFPAEHSDTTHDLTGSEWNDLMYKLMSWTPFSQRGENFAALDATLPFNGSTNGTGMNSDQLFQEIASNAQHLVRGLTNASGSWHPGKTGLSATTTARYWRPVLELMP